jgi:hypothetical protein
MSRAAQTTLVAVVLVLTMSLASCSKKSSHAAPFLTPPACPLLADMAKTGRAVAATDVGDPVAFNATLHTAVTQYVDIAHRLRGAVPVRLRTDVDQLEAAAQQYRFSDATAARAAIDDYARSTCRAGTPKS